MNGLSLIALMPPPSKQRDLLLQMVLNISKEQYLSKQEDEPGRNYPESSSSAGRSIQLDDNLNIFDIL